MKNLIVTPEPVYRSRRQFIKSMVQAGLVSASLSPMAKSAALDDEEYLTRESDATSYNNYYEFSESKDAVQHLAQDFTMLPWQIDIAGLVENPLSLALEALPDSEEHVYRFRCVEGWAMVVPWLGFSLSTLLEKAKPKAQAKYVKFTSVYRPEEMIGQRRSLLPWPYVEALRLDEAMHPLTLLVTGMYQKPLPAQNGGPLRLVVPWKYGFKSAKAINRIELVAEQPETAWNIKAPSEYGFYANVNPSVPHPRWSQRREVLLGELRKRPTLPFNGYEKEVAYMYENMDLAKYY